jgi:predicted nucleic acid-binding protein
VREVISDTSPLQYLHQAGLLDLLPQLYGRIVVGESVSKELDAGRVFGISLPDPCAIAWVEIRRPRGVVTIPAASGLGEGERQTLILGTESPGALLLLDDALARRSAKRMGLLFTGTLGVLINAKQAGHIDALLPVLNRLESLRFRFDPATRSAVLRLAGEAP